LSDISLFQQQAYIDGQWCDANSKEVIEVVNPATGFVLGHVPNMEAEETNKAIEAANEAWSGWKNLTARARGDILKVWHHLIVQHVDDLAIILTAEQGKPIAQAKGEILNGAAFVEWYAEEGRRAYGDVIPTHQDDTRILILKQSIGVSAAITPWNFPSSMITRKASAALAAGCPIVLKPSELTPFSALALAELAHRAGIPKGIFNVVTGDAKEIGGALCESSIVRKLSFTGSTAVGKILMKQCAETVKKLSLELGGNAPFIVFDDADLDLAVPGAIASKYRNSGQTCVCANRIFVQAGVYDAFMARFTEGVNAMKVGNGFDAGIEIGPMINQAGLEKTEEHIADALKKGGTIKAGGKKSTVGDLFFEPTIIENANEDMKCFFEETFGPVAPIFRFLEEKDVVKQANDTEYGLAAYIYTADLSRSFRVSEALEYGMVGVNSALLSTEQAPFGGIKASGFGREGSKYGIEDYLEIKYLCIGGI